MAQFANSALTKLGNAAVAQAIAGMELKFTRIAFGDGFVPEGTAPADLADLVHKTADVEIDHIDTHPEDTATVGGVYVNDDLPDGYWWRELGLFALMPATGEEVLFSYANAGELAEWIPATDSQTVFEKKIDLYVYVGSRAQVSLVVNPNSMAEIVRRVEALEDHMTDSQFLYYSGCTDVMPDDWPEGWLTYAEEVAASKPQPEEPEEPDVPEEGGGDEPTE